MFEIIPIIYNIVAIFLLIEGWRREKDGYLILSMILSLTAAFKGFGNVIPFCEHYITDANTVAWTCKEYFFVQNDVWVLGLTIFFLAGYYFIVTRFTDIIEKVGGIK